MQFGVLGPLRIDIDGGEEVTVTAGRERAVLAMLLLHADRAVPVGELMAAVWSPDPPRSARNQIQACVSTLRRLLARAGGETVIVSGPAGYRLRVDPQRVDAHRFRSLVATGRAAAAQRRLAEAAEAYRAAESLWRGPALAGLDGDPIRRTADALAEERIQAMAELYEVELTCGAGGELVADLTELARRHPYREGLCALLMRALCRAQRPADALAEYRRVRELLRDELGTEPGEELQRLHRAVLNGDPALTAGTDHIRLPAAMAAASASRAPAAAASVARGPVPRELPSVATGFVSRDRELAAVREAMVAPDRRRPPVVIVYGPGGVGKSALAIRIGHELADEFPDGQMYVDLCGSTPGMRRLQVLEILDRLLRRLGVPGDAVPADDAGAAALFRSMTADRQLLLVLDNAADKDQVVPLLPSGPGCGVLVTSRQPLASVDADGRLRLEVLPEREALRLLGGVCGRVDAGSDVARRLVELSGGLPLAVRIVGGRLACRPDLSVSGYAERLADDSRRLDELQLDDLAVRASIRTSYEMLGGDPAGREAARAFRMLGILRVPDAAPGVVAAMMGFTEVEPAREALDRLVDAQLVEPVPPDRYRLHDLVRLVAAESATEEDPPEDREGAITRALTHYSSGLWHGEICLRRTYVKPFAAPPVREETLLPAISRPAEARLWTDEELQALVAAVEQGVEMGGEAGRLVPCFSDVLWLNLDRRCEWRTAYGMSIRVLDAGRTLAEPELTACGHLLCGRSEACFGDYVAAVTHFDQAVTYFTELGNPGGVVLALNGLGVAEMRRGKPASALARFEMAVELADRHGLPAPAMGVVSNMAVSYVLAGDLENARSAAERGMNVAVAEQSLTHRASIALNLAVIDCLLGAHLEAGRSAAEALATARMAGDRQIECETLVVRAEANRRLGRFAESEADVADVLLVAQDSGYRFAWAAALRVRARIADDLGRSEEAAKLDARATESFASLGGVHRDVMLTRLLEEEGCESAGRAGGAAARVPAGGGR